MAKKSPQKHINYFVDMRPHTIGKSLHCQICHAVIFPCTWSGTQLTKCKCTTKELAKRKRFK